MIRIPLRRRDGTVHAYALVDDQDAHLLDTRWSMRNEGGYVQGSRGGQKVSLHRTVLGLGPGDPEVDHRNRDRLDCRRENLIVGTHAANMQNVIARPGSSSRFRGVGWDKVNRKWQAYITLNGRMRKLGYRRDEVEAALLADAARRELMPFALPDPELEAVLSSHTGASGKRLGVSGVGRVDPCEGMASPSQSGIHRPPGIGTPAVPR